MYLDYSVICFQSITKWHNRLGHLKYEMIKNMVRHQIVQGIQLSTKEPAILCQGCQFGKQQRAHFPINSVRQRAQFLGDIIHANLCGPMSVPSKGGSLYFAIFKDDSTLYRFLFCIPCKCLDMFSKSLQDYFQGH
jgi:hypothetical protein